MIRPWETAEEEDQITAAYARRRVPPPGDPSWAAAEVRLQTLIAELRDDKPDHSWIRDACGSWFDGRTGDAFDLASPQPMGAFGTLTPFGDHCSLELHGLSRAEVERVLQVLRAGY